MQINLSNVRSTLYNFIFANANKTMSKYIPFQDGYLKLVANDNNFTYNICDTYYEELYDDDKTFSNTNVFASANEIVGDIKLLIWGNN